MPRLLNKIGDPQNEISKINDNFDRISLDIAERSGTFSSTASLSGLVISADTTQTIQVDITDSLKAYEVNRLPVLPRIELYIDNNNNGDYLWPVGSAMSSLAHVINVDMVQARRVVDEATNEKATILIAIHNYSGSPHTIYLTFDAFYVPAPDQGIARRDM